MDLADVHAHLTHPRLAADVPDVLARARRRRHHRDHERARPADNEAVLALARRHPTVRPAFGLWSRQEDVFRAMVQLALDADKPLIVHTRKRERRVVPPFRSRNYRVRVPL
jgi:Tat protein secretion system quality control protein TatD with DNase activity